MFFKRDLETYLDIKAASGKNNIEEMFVGMARNKMLMFFWKVFTYFNNLKDKYFPYTQLFTKIFTRIKIFMDVCVENNFMDLYYLQYFINITINNI